VADWGWDVLGWPRRWRSVPGRCGAGCSSGSSVTSVTLPWAPTRERSVARVRSDATTAASTPSCRAAPVPQTNEELLRSDPGHAHTRGWRASLARGDAKALIHHPTRPGRAARPRARGGGGSADGRPASRRPCSSGSGARPRPRGARPSAEDLGIAVGSGGERWRRAFVALGAGDRREERRRWPVSTTSRGRFAEGQAQAALSRFRGRCAPSPISARCHSTGDAHRSAGEGRKLSGSGGALPRGRRPPRAGVQAEGRPTRMIALTRPRARALRRACRRVCPLGRVYFEPAMPDEAADLSRRWRSGAEPARPPRRPRRDLRTSRADGRSTNTEALTLGGAFDWSLGAPPAGRARRRTDRCPSCRG
jgi:hypothetical protein